jgi:DNA-binding CsgD family transcriptional regulator
MHETPENHIVLGRLIHAFIRAGWNPPTPSSRIARHMLEDIEEARVTTDGHVATDAPLSPQQRVALSLTAAGMNGPETAEVMEISHETVRSHLKQARQRLGACTLAHAVAIALHEGIIDLPGEVSRKTLAA